MIPSEIFLADPDFYQPAEVDFLIGAEYFYNLMRAGKIAIKGHSAIFQETDFGWIFSGRYVNPQPTDPNIQYLVNSNKSQVTCNAIRFQGIPLLWELGDENPSKILSEEEAAAEKLQVYVDTVKRDDIGRYSVKLPFNNKKELLGESNNIDEGHMDSISNQELSESGFYLPHHAVIKNDNITTKTRVVFDASAKTSKILVFLEDRKFQRIVWRPSKDQPIKIYSFNRVTFGTACAPHLVIRTLHQLASDEQEAFPLASKTLKSDFYGEDLLPGAQTASEALKIRNELIDLLSKEGFRWRKWASNDPRLCADFINDSTEEHMSFDLSDTVKTFGLRWNPRSNIIFIQFLCQSQRI